MLILSLESVSALSAHCKVYLHRGRTTDVVLQPV